MFKLLINQIEVNCESPMFKCGKFRGLQCPVATIYIYIYPGIYIYIQVYIYIYISYPISYPRQILK